MFKTKDKTEIGKYLSHLIKRRFVSTRQFGIRCLEVSGVESPDIAQINNMSNRLSQILNGNKEIQLSDLPIFTMLLDVSCEEILSAGTCFAATSNHLTNYSVALSKNETVWKEYIQREDQLILNADEYNKTIIDYALDNENYELLKYLMENEYIWFVGTDEENYFYDFGARTSIEPNNLLFPNIRVLDSRLREDELRIKMCILAIKHGDIDTLTELRAREIPSLYFASYHFPKTEDTEKYYNKNLMNALSNASDEILQYFSEEFEITNVHGHKNKYMFPFISELIDLLIQTNNDYAEWMLKDALKHNQSTYDKLTALLNNSASYMQDSYPYLDAEYIYQDIMRTLNFYDSSNIICYLAGAIKDGLITNIIQIKSTSDKVKINRLIQEINDLYDKIRNITPNI